MDQDVRDASQDFKCAAAPAADPVLVPIDPDIATWFRGQGDLIRQVNDLCRFYMDTDLSKQFEFDPGGVAETMASPVSRADLSGPEG